MIDGTVLLLGGCYASTALGPAEVFYSAGRLWSQMHGDAESPRFRVRTASVRGKRVSSPYGVDLMADADIGEIRKTDVVIVASAGIALDAQLAAHREMYAWLRRHEARGAYIAGACVGAAYRAEAGLLDGREATTHWSSARELQRRYPSVKWRPEKMVTGDRRVLCSGGVYASIDLSLYLVEKFCGHDIALQVAKSLVIDMPRVCQTGYAVLPLSRPHDDDSIRSAEASISRNFKRPLRVEDLARERHMSARNFIRRFKTATGRTPGDYLQATRTAVAKRLLESGTRACPRPSTASASGSSGWRGRAAHRTAAGGTDGAADRSSFLRIPLRYPRRVCTPAIGAGILHAGSDPMTIEYEPIAPPGRLDALRELRLRARLQAVVEESIEAHGEPVALVGWSLGGDVAREYAREHPDEIRRVVTLGSPVIGGPRCTATAEWYRSNGHDLDEMERAIMDRYATPLRVPVTAIYSGRDGVVAWQACIDRWSPNVRHVEVSETHVGRGFAPRVLGLVADELERD